MPEPEHRAVEGGFHCRHCGAMRETAAGISRHRHRCERRREKMSNPYAGPLQITGYVPPDHYNWTVADCEAENWDAERTREDAEAIVTGTDEKFVEGRLMIWPPGWSPEFLHDLMWDRYTLPDDDNTADESEPETVDELETMEDFL